LFERALSIVSLDYASHPLWDQYIEFELSQEEYKHVGQIFNRIIYIPLEQISTYWARYKLFISQQPIENVVTDEELIEINGYNSLDSLEKQRNWVIAKRELVYKKSSEESDNRRSYETEVLKISYFHVRPLTKNQIAAWDNYLAFEEKQGDHARIINLYERCIIPCVRTLRSIIHRLLFPAAFRGPRYLLLPSPSLQPPTLCPPSLPQLMPASLPQPPFFLW
jgi:pre-mRNA-processing factor 39